VWAFEPVRRMGISDQTARTHIYRLASVGLVRKISKGEW